MEALITKFNSVDSLKPKDPYEVLNPTIIIDYLIVMALNSKLFEKVKTHILGFYENSQKLADVEALLNKNLSLSDFVTKYPDENPLKYYTRNSYELGNMMPIYLKLGYQYIDDNRYINMNSSIYRVMTNQIPLRPELFHHGITPRMLNFSKKFDSDYNRFDGIMCWNDSLLFQSIKDSLKSGKTFPKSILFSRLKSETDGYYDYETFNYETKNMAKLNLIRVYRYLNFPEDVDFVYPKFGHENLTSSEIIERVNLGTLQFFPDIYDVPHLYDLTVNPTIEVPYEKWRNITYLQNYLNVRNSLEIHPQILVVGCQRLGISYKPDLSYFYSEFGYLKIHFCRYYESMFNFIRNYWDLNSELEKLYNEGSSPALSQFLSPDSDDKLKNLYFRFVSKNVISNFGLPHEINNLEDLKLWFNNVFEYLKSVLGDFFWDFIMATYNPDMSIIIDRMTNPFRMEEIYEEFTKKSQKYIKLSSSFRENNIKHIDDVIRILSKN